MKNIILQSLLLAGIVSNTNAQNQYQPQDNRFENYQSQPSNRKLRLNEIKAKLNRLKTKRSKNRDSQNDSFSAEPSRNSRTHHFQQPTPQNFVTNRPQMAPNQGQQHFDQRPVHKDLTSATQAKMSRTSNDATLNNYSLDTNDSRRAFSKRGTGRQNSYDTALVRSCENAGRDLILRGNQGEKARSFYANRCDQLISKLSIQHKLDNLLDLQGKYLSLQGRHQDANRFITLAYQQAPNALNTNIALIKNLVSLGQAAMAEEMLLFYIGEKGVQNLNPREHQSLKTLHQQLKRMQ